jgi:hypothetical protein
MKTDLNQQKKIEKISVNRSVRKGLVHLARNPKTWVALQQPPSVAPLKKKISSNIM